MSPEFAAEIADVRLRQTARLLEWLLDNAEADLDAVRHALGAVVDAHAAVRGLDVRVQPAAS